MAPLSKLIAQSSLKENWLIQLKFGAKSNWIVFGPNYSAGLHFLVHLGHNNWFSYIFNDEGYSKENLLHFKDDEYKKIEVFNKLVIWFFWCSSTPSTITEDGVNYVSWIEVIKGVMGEEGSSSGRSWGICVGNMSVQIYYVHPVAIDTTIHLKLLFGAEIFEWVHNWTAQWCMMKRHWDNNNNVDNNIIDTNHGNNNNDIKKNQ